LVYRAPSPMPGYLYFVFRVMLSFFLDLSPNPVPFLMRVPNFFLISRARRFSWDFRDLRGTSCEGALHPTCMRSSDSVLKSDLLMRTFVPLWLQAYLEPPRIPYYRGSLILAFKVTATFPHWHCRVIIPAQRSGQSSHPSTSLRRPRPPPVHFLVLGTFENQVSLPFVILDKTVVQILCFYLSVSPDACIFGPFS